MDTLQQLQFTGGLGSLLGGMFGNSGAPYGAAMDQYTKYLNQAKQTQNPFYQAGTAAIPQYQGWLDTMKNPSGFINTLMNQYQESPWAKYQQQQAVRAAQNLGSASGLTGSTALQQQAQQNAANISSADMQNWLQNVLGINTQFGAGTGNLVGAGQASANALTNLLGEYGKMFGEQAYNKEAAENNDFWNMIGGGVSLASMLL